MTDSRSLRVLLVEDEAMVAMMASDMLDAIGHEVVHVAHSLAAALDATEAVAFDVALVDVNLGGESGLKVADRLHAAGRPYVLATGYGSRAVAAPHDAVPCLVKPYMLAELETTLANLAV